MFELAGQVHEYPQFFASLRMTFDPHYHAVQFVRCIARLVHCYPNMADHDVTQFVSELQEEIKTLLDTKAYWQKIIELNNLNIAVFKEELAQPFLSSKRKQNLQEQVQEAEILINQYEQNILQIEEGLLKKSQLALRELDYITLEATKKGNFSLPPEKPLTDDVKHESQSQRILYKNERIPGAVFVKDQRILEKISSVGKKIDHECDVGISINIPEGSISPDESVDLLIQPCFSGSFEIPEDMEPASPAYLIETSKQIVLKKPFTVRIQHSAKLQTEEDCKTMVFLRASSDPEYRGSDPIYVFREIEGAGGKFNEGSQFGEVALTHFSFLRPCKKRKNKGNLYSARLYRSLSATAEASAVFCMCPMQILYTQFCDEIICEEYSEISKKAEGRTVYNALAITSDVVALEPQDATKCIMDKSKIIKDEIDSPLTYFKSKDLSEVPDYPPRIKITTTTRSASLTLSTNGLKKNCTFLISAITKRVASTDQLQEPTYSKLLQSTSSEGLYIGKRHHTSAGPHDQPANGAGDQGVDNTLLPQNGHKRTPSASGQVSVKLPVIMAYHLQLIKWINPNGEEAKLKIYEEMSSKWKEVAGVIGLSNAEISNIAAAGMGRKMIDCLREVFGKWMDNCNALPKHNCYPLTWDGLCNILKDSDSIMLVNPLKEALAAKQSTLRDTFPASHDILISNQIEDTDMEISAPTIAQDDQSDSATSPPERVTSTSKPTHSKLNNSEGLEKRHTSGYQPATAPTEPSLLSASSNPPSPSSEKAASINQGQLQEPKSACTEGLGERCTSGPPQPANPSLNTNSSSSPPEGSHQPARTKNTYRKGCCSFLYS